MLEFQHVTKRYPNGAGVFDIDFCMEKNGVYGLLGVNGAGKTTIMNIMTGYLGATEGDVVIYGHDILEEPEEAKACLGYLPEIPPVYPDMRVIEYLDFAADLKRIRVKDRVQEVDRVVELLGLTQVQERLIRNLSKGYKQRVGMAQALLGSPKIIVLDEPTVGLDPRQIIEIRQMIRELGKNHIVLFSSHILAEVQEVCDRILIISAGKLMAQGTPTELENMVQKEAQIVISARIPSARMMEILGNVPGISRTECRPIGDNETKAVIYLEKGRDITEKLFFAFADQHVALRSLTENKITLEDAFLEITQQGEMEQNNEKKEDGNESNL